MASMRTRRTATRRRGSTISVESVISSGRDTALSGPWRAGNGRDVGVGEAVPRPMPTRGRGPGGGENVSHGRGEGRSRRSNEGGAVHGQARVLDRTRSGRRGPRVGRGGLTRSHP